ncbi:uncharacterized protein K452DRAFT_283044 [Aplosporella prunicola CBS 121167]|uniref:Uncharacterized protein n=1 Tax=Aplosporella prunicola CBS 121167 TaxID=1176127 RepID=A0A6A6BVW7_9PEZI|nr:uncharacterized protein K452DRAFT_283044 [Aplosporella prunicola CBS 121167]KAF2146841.1 hypothetical protein K452DRAFT_283044 [Aplosporella prunicola CBS 121167]
MPAGNSDDALLARLNALKTSSVSLSTAPPPAESEPDIVHEMGLHSSSNEPEGDPILDLAARFKRLNNNSGASSAAPGTEPVEIQASNGEEKSLEQLLKELGGDEWDIGKHEEKDVGTLVREVRKVLPDVKPGSEQENQKNPDVGREGIREDKAQDPGDSGDDSELDDQEADEYIAQVLAELDINAKCGEADGECEEAEATNSRKSNEGEDNSTAPESRVPISSADDRGSRQDITEESTLSLPAAPTTLPTSPSQEDDFDKATAVDDALTARLAALSDTPGLPSAPSFAPAKKPPVKVGKASKFTDEEIDSWCIICYDDATVRCLGCDGDLYCQGCWNEGHRGESAGYEEKMHKAVQFVKGGGKRKSLVGAG